MQMAESAGVAAAPETEAAERETAEGGKAAATTAVAASAMVAAMAPPRAWEMVVARASAAADHCERRGQVRGVRVGIIVERACGVRLETAAADWRVDRSDECRDVATLRHLAHKLPAVGRVSTSRVGIRSDEEVHRPIRPTLRLESVDGVTAIRRDGESHRRPALRRSRRGCRGGRGRRADGRAR